MDEGVGEGVKEANKKWEVALDGDDGAKLWGIRGEELEEGVKGLVLEINGADLEAGEEVADDEGEVSMGDRGAREVEDDDAGTGRWWRRPKQEEEVEVMEVEEMEEVVMLRLLWRISLPVGTEESRQRVAREWREQRVDRKDRRRSIKRGLAGQWEELVASTRED